MSERENPPEDQIEISPITAAQTHELRRIVLRDGTLTDGVRYSCDADPGTFHLGAFQGAALIGVSTWAPSMWEHREHCRGHQLRGMAIAPLAQGLGVGGLLLDAGIERCREAGVEFVWANARASALGFYARHGFVPSGDRYIDTVTTGLLHQAIVIDLA